MSCGLGCWLFCVCAVHKVFFSLAHSVWFIRSHSFFSLFVDRQLHLFRVKKPFVCTLSIATNAAFSTRSYLNLLRLYTNEYMSLTQKQRERGERRMERSLKWKKKFISHFVLPLSVYYVLNTVCSFKWERIRDTWCVRFISFRFVCNSNISMVHGMRMRHIVVLGMNIFCCVFFFVSFCFLSFHSNSFRDIYSILNCVHCSLYSRSAFHLKILKFCVHWVHKIFVCVYGCTYARDINTRNTEK